MAALVLSVAAGAPFEAAVAAPLPAPHLPRAAADGPTFCGAPVLDRAEPAARALAHATPTTRARVRAAAQDASPAAMQHLRTDHELWLDTCGKPFYVDSPTPRTPRPHPSSSTPTARASSTAASTAVSTAASAAAGRSGVTSAVPLADTFHLASLPGSDHTLYLDFVGGQVTGTAWNSTYGDPLTVAPYSKTAPVDTAFTDSELTEIQRAWQVVAEDYAPFDVNVTTQDPGLDRLERSSASDPTYGTRVFITAGGPIYDQCGCGGVAYVDVFNAVGATHAAYQPAWVFTNGTTTTGKYIGEAAAHEAGHNFGLYHDGTPAADYYEGASPWAPIMGASYDQPVSQWSQGEYAGANQTQDDLAIIATGAPLRPDDYPDTPETATALASGQTLSGVIGTRQDRDAFTFHAAGATTLSVTPADGLPDLDVRLSIVDSTGATVADLNPPVTRVSSTTATGMGATWSTTLPAAPAGGAPAPTYTAIIDGAGTGDPTTPGQYSDYASLGNYQVSLSTAATPAPLTLTATTPTVDLLLGSSYRGAPATAAGGTAPYAYSADQLPAGLSMDPTTGTIGGTPTGGATSTSSQLRVVDATGTAAATTVTFTSQDTPVVAHDQTYPAEPGAPMSRQLIASGGSGPLTWASTDLPDPLTLSPAGLLTGTLPAATVAPVSFHATVTSPGGAHGTLSVTLEPRTPLTAADQALTVPLGRPVAAQLAAHGGQAPYVWRAAAGSSFPPGLTLSSTGAVSGSALISGVWVTTVEVSSGTATATMRATVTVTPDALQVPTSTVDGRVGQPLLVTLQHTGGPQEAAYTWSAAGLPAGLVVRPDGVLSGTPVAASTTDVTLTLTATTAAGEARATGVLHLAISIDALVVVPQTLPARAGLRVSQDLQTANAAPGEQISWTAQNLPPGLSLSRAGHLTGTPRRAGVWTVTVRARSAARTGQGTLTVRVQPALPPRVTTATVSAVSGVAFRTQLHAAGTDGAPDVSWSATGLPPGVHLTPGGVLWGTASKAGATRIAVSVRAWGTTARDTVTLTLDAPA